MEQEIIQPIDKEILKSELTPQRDEGDRTSA